MVWIAEDSTGDGIAGKTLPEGLCVGVSWCFCFVACSCDICLALFASLLLSLFAREEHVLLSVRELNDRSPEFFWGILALSRDTVSCHFLRGMRTALSGYCCWMLKHSCSCIFCHSAWIPLSELAGSDQYARYPCDALLGHQWLRLVRHEPLSEGVFWEEWKILGTSTVVFRTTYRNKLITAAPPGWQGSKLLLSYLKEMRFRNKG